MEKTSKMKLLYITNALNGSGGLERVLSIKASYLADKLGYEVHLMTLNKGHIDLFYEFSPKLMYHDIPVFGNPIAYLKRYSSGIKKTIKTVQPDVIIVCDDGLKAFFLPTLLGKSIPIFYERHVSKSIEIGSNFSIGRLIIAKTKMKLMDVLSSTFTKFIVLTSGNAKEWNAKNLLVIPNPLSFYPSESASLTNKKVIAVGKQSYQKGYDRLLNSWQLVSATHPDWHLEVYGKLDPSQGLEKLASDLGIQEKVQFFEAQKNIEAIYLQSSIYVMSSRFEGFGMVLIEAMACGVPCISFDCPYGPSDIIQNGEDGFLVANGDEAALVNKLNLLIENAALRMQMGQKSKQNVKRFLPDVVLTQWDELFKSVAK